MILKSSHGDQWLRYSATSLQCPTSLWEGARSALASTQSFPDPRILVKSYRATTGEHQCGPLELFSVQVM
jgi:hypothetical protein